MNVNSSNIVTDNPGFSPFVESEKDDELRGYSLITGFFNQDYAMYDNLSYKDEYDHFYHEGVDFRCTFGTKIHSLICAEVIGFGWMHKTNDSPSGYGRSVWLKRSNGKGVYLLAHLSRFVDHIYVGMKIYGVIQ